jgi:hypothetical protein
LATNNPKFWLEKRSHRKTGYPIGTIAYYGVDDKFASKVVAGIDYPQNEKCPHCPFWANRDRWTGEIIN